MKFAIWQLKKAIENSTMLVTTLTKEEKTMAKTKDTTFFENKLLDFVTAQDPMLEMMHCWMCVSGKTAFTASGNPVSPSCRELIRNASRNSIG